MTTPRLILVLGPHRSGTSLIARSLKCLGVELGPRAEWSGSDNETGFWEDQDVLDWNVHFLKYLGYSWDELIPPWRHIDLPMQLREWADDTIGNLLRERLAAFPLFGIKEPRLSLLLQIWKRPIRNLGCPVSVIHVVRHPLAVAASLTKRNGIPTEQGLALWLEYTKRAREDCDLAWPAVTVSYENMMALPVQQVERIGAALGLAVAEVETLRFARHFVDDTLWHENETDGPMPTEVEVLWRVMSEEAMR